MPVPYKGDCYSNNSVVLQRPSCAIAIGAICAAWSSLEGSLASHYTMLCLGYRTIQDGSEFIVMEGFESIPQMQQKRNFLVNAAKKRGFQRATIEKFSSALKRIQDLSLERNDVVHGRWALTDSEPEKLVWTRRLGDLDNMKLYDQKDFVDLLGRITKASKDLEVIFTDEMIPRLKVIAEAYVNNVAAIKQAENSG